MTGERIRKLRKEAGMTQRQLAQVLGVSPAAVGNYEQGTRIPGYDILNALARCFHVSAEYLIAEKEEAPDLERYVELLTNDLLASRNVLFDGQPLRPEEVEKVIQAIKIGVRIALEKRNPANC